MNKKIFAAALALACATAGAWAQTFDWISSTENNVWQQSKVKARAAAGGEATLDVAGGEPCKPFRGWGVTFNELDWDALCLLTGDEQDEILRKVFAPDGDLRATRGRLSMGANDYSRSWYSNDETPGDLELRHFNLDRDLATVIPFVRAAQRWQPRLVCWVSPWCPPSWMKINGDYPVLSSKYNKLSPKADYMLYGNMGGKADPDEMKLLGDRSGVFPKRLATTDYMIQDPRYLQAYANLFCKFIDAYRAEGIAIDRVIYQNEAYSYTPYPGCAWTAEGTVRFNRDYLAPTLKARHPEVELYLGTFNTNRRDYVEKIVDDSTLLPHIAGVAFQWEGREVLPHVRRAHPDLEYMCSESECGWGSFDWKAGEHTFELINHYLGNGCTEYTFWNFILEGGGVSPWGWKQNALIRVDGASRTFAYTPEYHAVRHYTRFVAPGSRVLAHKDEGADKMPVLALRDARGKTVVVCGNFADKPQPIAVRLAGGKWLKATLAPHSYNTFAER